jgi:putative membrane protein
MRRGALTAGAALLGGAWWLAVLSHSMTAHMLAHMTAVAVAAPFIAAGIAGTRFDPATRWPKLAGPLQMSLVELAVVWSWHAPAARALAASSAAGLALEQLTFAAAGLLLWSACFGTLDSGSSARRATAIGALLLTTMHMTLLGTLLALAPRMLYGTHGARLFALAPLQDQQLAGVVMLTVGGASYLAGGVWLLAGLLRGHEHEAAGPWS